MTRLEWRLAHYVTEYDRKQAKKRYYNPYALPQYLGRAQEVAKRADSMGALAAIQSGFTGPLEAFLIRNLTKEGLL